jgi:hypothetical protein
MLREVGKIYSRAFWIFFQYRIFGGLSLSYIIINYALGSFLSFARSQRFFGLVVLIQCTEAIVSFVIPTGLPLALILMVYRIEKGEELTGIFQQTKQNFWNFFGQFWAGFLIALLYTLPAFCLVLFAVFMDTTLFMMIFIPLWVLIYDFLSLGSISLGQRILLDKGEGTFKNSLQGLRIVNGNFAFFITLYIVITLIFVIQISLPYLIGSAITGVDLFFVPISQYSLFLTNIVAATNTPYVTGMRIILGTILYPINAIVPTLAYLRFKSYKIPHRIKLQPQKTEN